MTVFKFPVQPVTFSAGAGLATEAKQDSSIVLLTSIDGKDFATQTTLAVVAGDTTSIDSKIPANLTVTSTRLLVDGSGVTQPVSAASLPLPTGAATSALQTSSEAILTTIDADTSIIAGAVSGTEMQVDVLTMPSVTVTATDLDIRDLTSVSDSVSAVQSGTWNITNVSGTISLPTGAATSALQTTGNSSLSTIAGAVSGTEMQVDVLTSALPTGASTSALQTSSEAILTDIESNTNPVDVVDLLDSTLVDTSSTNIPASSGGFLEVVASSAAAVKKVQIVEDIGEFYGIYTGAAASEVLVAVAPLGGGFVDVAIPASTRISLRALENSAITSGLLSMNLIG
jgi:hypothetical protein